MELDEFQSDRLNEISPEQATLFDGQKFLRSLHAWLKTNPPLHRVQEMRQFMLTAFDTVDALTPRSTSGILASACGAPLLETALYPPYKNKAESIIQ